MGNGIPPDASNEVIVAYLNEIREDVRQQTTLLREAMSEGAKDRSQLNSRLAVAESDLRLVKKLLYAGLGGLTLSLAAHLLPRILGG